MASESVIDQIVKSLSFEVEATPQEDENIQTTSTSNITPLNVKIRVRKKHESNVEKAIISVPKFGNPDGAPERVRLISSDQTIMSFNVLMEADYIKRGKKRFRKYLFGGCLGTQYDDDDGPYVPSSTYKAETVEKNIISKSEAVIKKNLTLSKNQQGHINPVPPFKNHSVLGKCKPGGCLDPPFSEDKYSYKPVNKNEILIKSTPKPGAKKKNTKKIAIPKNNNSKSNVIGKKNGDSVLNIYKTDRLHDSIDTKYSDAIITYPPEVTSSTNINEKFLRTRIYTDEKQRRSIIEGSEVFYSPAKPYRREEFKERKISDKTFSNAYNINKELPNSQNLTTEKTDTKTGKLISTDESSQNIRDCIPNKPTKLLNRTSVDQSLQGDKKDSYDILYNQKIEMKPNLMNENLDRNSLTLLSTSKSLQNNKNNSLNDSFHKIAHEEEQTCKRTCTPDEKSNSYFNISDNIKSASKTITENYVIDRTSQQFTTNKLKQFDDYMFTSQEAVNKNGTTSIMEPTVDITGKDRVSEKGISDKNVTENNSIFNQNVVNGTVRQIYFDPPLPKNIPVRNLKSYEKIELTKEELGHGSSKDFVERSTSDIDQRDHNESKSNQGFTTPSNKEFNISNKPLRSFSSNELKHIDYHNYTLNETVHKNAIIPLKDSLIATRSKKIIIGDDKKTIPDDIYYDNINMKLEKLSNSYPISDPLVTNEFDKQNVNKFEKSYTTTNQEKPILSSEIGNLDKINLLKKPSTEQVISSEFILTHVDSTNKNASILSKESGSVCTNKDYTFEAKNSNKKKTTDPFIKVIDKTEFRHIDLGRSSEQNKEFNDTKESTESYSSYNITYLDEQIKNLKYDKEAAENDLITTKKGFKETKNNEFESNGKTEIHVKIPIEREQYPETKDFYKTTNDENSSSPHNNESLDKTFYQHNKTKPNIMSTDSDITSNIITRRNVISNRESLQKEASRNLPTRCDSTTASHEESSSNLNTENDPITAKKEFKEAKNDEFHGSRKIETHINIPMEREQYPETKDFLKTTNDENGSSPHNNESFGKTLNQHNISKFNRLSTDSDITSKIITRSNVISKRESLQKEASRNLPTRYDSRTASHEDSISNLNTEKDPITAKKELKEAKNDEFHGSGKTETHINIPMEQEQYPETKDFLKTTNDENGSSPHNNESFGKTLNQHNISKFNRLSTDSYKIITPKTIKRNGKSLPKEASRIMPTHYDNRTSSREDSSSNLHTKNDSIITKKEFKEAKNNEFESNGITDTHVKMPIEREQYPETKDFHKATNDENGLSPHSNESRDKIFYQRNKTKPNILSTDNDITSKIITSRNFISNGESSQKEASQSVPIHYDNRSTSREDSSSNLHTNNDSIITKKEFKEAKNNEFESNGITDTYVEIPIEREQYPETKDFHKTTNDENGLSPHSNESRDKIFYQHNKTKPNILSTDNDITSKIISSRNFISNGESSQKEAYQNVPIHYDNRFTSREDSSSNLKAVDGSYSENIGSKELLYKSSERYNNFAKYPDFNPAHGITEQTVSYIDPRLRSSNTNNEIILMDEKIANSVRVLEESINNTTVDKDQNEKSKTKYETGLSSSNGDSDFTPASPIHVDVNNLPTKYPNITTKNGSPRSDNIFSEQGDKMSGLKVPLQYYSTKNSNNNTNATKSLDDIRSINITSKASFISIEKFHENLGTSFIEEYESSKPFKDSTVSRKSSLKNEVISLNMGFKSYTNAKKERIVETIEASKEPLHRSNNDIVTYIKAQIRSHVNDIRIPIDSENEMSIQIRRSKSPQRVQIQSSGQLNEDKTSLKFLQKDEAKLTDKEIEKLFDSVYERDLIPLQKAFKYLKQDVAILAYQQSKFKDKAIGPKRSKSIRIVKVNPKCCCCWKK